MDTPNWMGGANHFDGEDRPEYSSTVGFLRKQWVLSAGHRLDNRAATVDLPSQVSQLWTAVPKHQPESHA